MINSIITIAAASFTRYRGCTIEKHQGQFKALRHTYDTAEEAQAAIDQAYSTIKINRTCHEELLPVADAKVYPAGEAVPY